MTYRDILVSMDGGETQAATARFAADLAAKFGATLVGAYARSQVGSPFVAPDVTTVLTAAEIQRMADAYERAVAAAAETARQAFEAAAGEQEVGSAWQVVSDSEALAAAARRTDLLVLGAAGDRARGGLEPASLAMASGGPAILVPAGAAPSTFRRIVVAWNGSREAARALRAAWPLIGLADAVDVVIISRGGADEADSLLQRHFEHHGVRPNVILDQSGDAPAGVLLRRQIETIGPDLVVMGLYGRPRIQELVLGGVSRQMLEGPKVPLFVSH